MKPKTLSFRAPSLRDLMVRWLPLLLLSVAALAARAQPGLADPPGRVAILSHMEGSIVYAPPGETDWTDAVRNRPITVGDRLWADDGARAEVHLGSSTLHMAARTFVELIALDDDVLHINVNEGVVNARVRQLQGGENFEINTPQLALRTTQPGDLRIEVDAARGITRVTVRAGAAVVYGAGGGTMQLQCGQQMAFAGRDLAQATGWPAQAHDGFDRWAAERNRAEDQSMAARYVPREVVGYQQLDDNGTWAQDVTYGPVWYPRVTVADWAPYRYGRWDWIAPWGWTWIDDAPWGFAPFHYGRWAEIGSRWAWVPGRLGPRPVYAPALVAFVGGGNWSLSVGSSSGIGWYPLGPGEAWQPTYRASPIYVQNVNRYVVLAPGGRPYYQRRPEAITTVRVEDFSRGRPVHQHWNRMNPADMGRVQAIAPPAMPERRRWADSHRPAQLQVQPRVHQFTPPVVLARPQALQPQPQFQGQGPVREERQPQFRPRDEARQWQHQQQREMQQREMQQREMQQRDQQHQRAQSERAQHERAQRDQRDQQVRMQQERAQRELQVQQAQQMQQQQQQQMHVQRQREHFERQQAQQQHQQQQHQLNVQRQREHAERQQAHQQLLQQQRAAAMQQQRQVHAPQPEVAPVPPQQHPRGEARGGRGQAQHEERVQRQQQREQRGERAVQNQQEGEEEGGPGRGHRFN